MRIWTLGCSTNGCFKLKTFKLLQNITMKPKSKLISYPICIVCYFKNITTRNKQIIMLKKNHGFITLRMAIRNRRKIYKI